MAEGQKAVVVYRLQPWEWVDKLVFDMTPPDFEVVPMGRTELLEERQQKLANADFLMGSWVTSIQTLTEDDFKAAPKLQLVQLMSAGYEHLDLDLAARYGVPIAHFGGSNATAVAESAIMLVLAWHRRLVESHAAVVRGAWRTSEKPLHELRGKRVGIVGLGFIGKAIAERLRAFQVDLVYYSRTRLTPEQEQQLGLRYMTLDDLLRASAVVCLSVALTKATRHLIGARELGLMKPDAILVNVSRGPVVDEAALYEALKNGGIAGAALDVLEQEPPNPAAPILQLENVLFTPHNAGSVVEVWPRVVELCFDNMRRVWHGEQPLHLARKLD